MIVTEEEAKTKRCQESYSAAFFRQRHPDTALSDYILPPVNCIGTACMAWRWKTEPQSAYTDYATTKDGKHPSHGKPDAWTHVEGDETGATWSRQINGKPGAGYCGKAGHW